MSSFSFLVFAVFDFSQKKPQSFLSSRPILADFWFFWGNNSSKQKKKTFFDHFLDFELIFRCHNQRMEKFNWIFRFRTICSIFWEKKFINKIKHSRSSPGPDFLGVTISSHIVSFRFLPIPGHLQNSGRQKLVDLRQKN